MSSSHKIIIITAPSGAGKTSITKHLLKTFRINWLFLFLPLHDKKEVMRKMELIIIL
jgi:uridine kinase